MKRFRTLELAIEFYQRAKGLKLNGVMQDQFDRALLSIVLNLSEGNAKPTAKDRRKFFYISYASFREIQTLLLLSQNKILLTASDSLGAPFVSPPARQLLWSRRSPLSCGSVYKLCQNTK